MYDIFFFKQKTAYEMRISDWSSDVCSSDLERSESQGHQIDDKQFASAVFTKGDKRADCLQRGETSKNAGERTHHTLLGTVKAGTVRIIADEAAITRLARLPATVDGELSLELTNGRRNQWNFKTGGSICHGQTGGDIVEAVQHKKYKKDGGEGIVGRDALMDGGDGHVRGEPGDGFPCGVGLGTTNIGGCEQHLPLQVGKVDRVIVDDGQLAHTRCGEILDRRIADAARANDGDKIGRAHV